ncbi:MAG: cbb3-type cytochrome c oxidase subunit I [Rhodomicrobium sp.]
MHGSNRLSLFNFWIAFGFFLPAAFLGAWQMLRRSPLVAPLEDPNAYYLSVTLHGTVMAYVVTTFFAMGFGYTITATSLDRPIRGMTAAWVGSAVSLIGALLAAGTVLAGRASVLYTFYPPLLANPAYYIGLALLVGGSMVWVVLMVLNMAAWKRDHPGEPVPLAMFGIAITALLWAWSASGVVVEIVTILLPQAFGWTTLLDAGLARTLFSITLHSIVYFWLLPAYIAFYTLLPQAAGGRLYSDTMGRLTFIMLLIFSVPVGMHHLLADPEHGNGFKFMQSFLTFLVALPTLLTAFSIWASLEIAGRVRGGRGLLGWIWALPWAEPMVLAAGLSFVMLGFGGFGGIINMSYAMNSMIHNTSWVTAHFHLIFGGTTVIMYFAIAYALWPGLTRRPLRSKTLACVQLSLWFCGMLITTIPWHATGMMGQPRRVAWFDYSDPLNAPMKWLDIVTTIGGLILLISAILFIAVLIRSQLGERGATEPVRYALAVNPPRQVPASLNNVLIWNVILAVFVVFAYGWPIGQFFFIKPHSVPTYQQFGPQGGR